MSKGTDDRHLLRSPAEGEAGSRPLSVPTGMERLRLEERILSRGESLRTAPSPASEGFIYVLAGAGVGTDPATGADPQVLGTGDFVGIAPGESVGLNNPHDAPLKVLIGFSGPDPSAAVQQQQ